MRVCKDGIDGVAEQRGARAHTRALGRFMVLLMGCIRRKDGFQHHAILAFSRGEAYDDMYSLDQ